MRAYLLLLLSCAVSQAWECKPDHPKRDFVVFDPPGGRYPADQEVRLLDPLGFREIEWSLCTHLDAIGRECTRPRPYTRPVPLPAGRRTTLVARLAIHHAREQSETYFVGVSSGIVLSPTFYFDSEEIRNATLKIDVPYTYVFTGMDVVDLVQVCISITSDFETGVIQCNSVSIETRTEDTVIVGPFKFTPPPGFYILIVEDSQGRRTVTSGVNFVAA